MLTVAVLTKNEELCLADCLESVKEFADEVLIVDDGSEDRTVEIAKKVGARVILHKTTSFSDKRNFAMDNSKSNWVLYLDADERATEEFKKEAKEVMDNFREEEGVGGYFVRRNNFYYGQEWGFVDKMHRLFYKKKFKRWVGDVHETAEIEGRFGEIGNPVIHDTRKSIERMVEKTNTWSEIEADLRFRAHHPKMTTLRFVKVMITGFTQSYFRQNGYKNGTAGIIEAIYQSFSLFITYAKLWERQVK